MKTNSIIAPAMDEKQGHNAMPMPGRVARKRGLLPLLLLSGYLAYSTWNLVRGPPTSAGGRDFSDQVSSTTPAVANGKLVPLEAHIMSKCPDARDCLRDLVLPTMMRTHEKVNFTLSYIGTPTENDGIECKHGPSECMGNIIELCAAHLYPDPKINLGFIMCLTRDYAAIPERSLVEDCALEHAIDFKALNDCAAKDDGAVGLGMLRDSIQRSTDAGVTRSCTVRLDNEMYCIRDGGEWKDCPHGPGVNDLVIAIEKLYRSSSS